MDAAEKAWLLSCLDEMLELVEADMRGDDAGWNRRVDALVARQDQSFENVMRMLSKFAADTTIGLAGLTKTPAGVALKQARLVLMQWVEQAP